MCMDPRDSSILHYLIVVNTKPESSFPNLNQSESSIRNKNLLPKHLNPSCHPSSSPSSLWFLQCCWGINLTPDWIRRWNVSFTYRNTVQTQKSCAESQKSNLTFLPTDTWNCATISQTSMNNYIQPWNFSLTSLFSSRLYCTCAVASFLSALSTFFLPLNLSPSVPWDVSIMSRDRGLACF